ncbi:hypothetical protein PCE1_000454 [Barthelona sp. PCE]
MTLSQTINQLQALLGQQDDGITAVSGLTDLLMAKQINKRKKRRRSSHRDSSLLARKTLNSAINLDTPKPALNRLKQRFENDDFFYDSDSETESRSSRTSNIQRRIVAEENKQAAIELEERQEQIQNLLERLQKEAQDKEALYHLEMENLQKEHDRERIREQHKKEKRKKQKQERSAFNEIRNTLITVIDSMGEWNVQQMDTLRRVEDSEEKITMMQDEVKGALNTLAKEVDHHNSRFKHLLHAVDELKTTLESDGLVSELEDRVNIIETRQNENSVNLVKQLSGIELRFNNVEQEFKNRKHADAALEKRIANTVRSIVDEELNDFKQQMEVESLKTEKKVLLNQLTASPAKPHLNTYTYSVEPLTPTHPTTVTEIEQPQKEQKRTSSINKKHRLAILNDIKDSLTALTHEDYDM